MRRFHSAGWIASIVGAIAIGDAPWNSTPVGSVGVVVAVLLLANGLPNLTVALVHHRRAVTTVEEVAPDVFRGSGTHVNFVLLRDGDALTRRCRVHGST